MSDSRPNHFTLHVLGTPDLRAPDGRRIRSVLSQPKRLGLLTYLALARSPVSRASLVALFWPESDESRARNALSQAVFHLRRSLSEDVVRSVEGDRLWAPPEGLWCDARERLAGNGAPDAVDGAPGALLEGWNADDSQELQEWLDTQRRRLHDVAPLSTMHATPRAEAPAPDAEAPPPRPAQPTAPMVWLVALCTVGAALWTVAEADEGMVIEAAPPTEDLVVLLPHVSAVPEAPYLDGHAVHAELLASLPHLERVRIVPAAYAESMPEFRRQLGALGIGAPEQPRWVLEVNVRVTREQARVVGLLYRAPTFDLPGRESFDVRYGGAEVALLEAPQEIGRGVSEMVARVMSAEPRVAR